MTRLVVVMLLVLMSFSGIAQAQEKKIVIEGVGEVNESTAYMLKIMRARQARASQTLASVEKIASQEETKSSVNVESAAVASSQVANVASVVAPYTATPVSTDNQKFFKHSFGEVSAYAGGWYAMGAKSKGVWTLLEWTHWMTKKEKPENFGIGATLKADYGENRAGYHWGYIAPGINLDYYRALTPKDDILVKARPLYRFGQRNSGSGFMPGGYLQYSHVLGSQDKIITSADGQYFRNDSYLGLSLMWEHRFNPDFKVRGGAVLGINFLKGETVVGIGPEIVFDLYDRFEIGLSANFAKNGPFLGAFAGYKLNTDLRAVDAAIRQRSVKLEQQGTTIAPEGIRVEKSSDGSYTTLPGAVSISTKTLDESNP